MSVKFFGQFLLEKGKIIREELLDAQKFQKTVNVKLGMIALDAGYLTKEQVEGIHARQQQSDKMFGEIAVDEKFLTEQELEELLLIQKNEHITLGEALVQKGYLSLSELSEELAAFKQTQEGVSDKVYEIIKDAEKSIIPETFLDITIKLFRRLVDIDLKVIDSHKNADRISPHLWNIHQNFSGDCEGAYVLSVPDPVLLQLVSHIAQEKIWEIDDFAKDGAKEFVNFVVGNSAAKLSLAGTQINLAPPKIVTSLGNVDLPKDKMQVVSAKLDSPNYELHDQNLQVSLLYLPNR